MEKFDLAVRHELDGSKFNHSIRLGVRNEFANAAFRLHSMIPSKIGSLGLRFKNTYQNPELIINGHLEKMMQGACKVPSEKYDHYYVTDATDYLAKYPGKLFGTDLGSIDIQRGRDHGLAPYIAMVKFCSEGRINILTFDDLAPSLMPKKRAEILKKNYEAVEDIDLWVGMQMEHIFPGSEVGPTAVCIIAKQFYSAKFGDRFYFEHKDEAPSFTIAQRNSLKQCSLSRLLCDNSNITHVQKNVMLLPSFTNPEVLCEDIPQIDFTYWTQAP
ncbi:Peroxidase [Araneus ventricosus]|uniref:Peroxidase n=1 Tax=Araneus ventricosus TaxID=182803 RepID=A0A4Y2DSY2_ARAVE|nr:Peroxidase [Araneus ventricosus]